MGPLGVIISIVDPSSTPSRLAKTSDTKSICRPSQLFRRIALAHEIPAPLSMQSQIPRHDSHPLTVHLHPYIAITVDRSHFRNGGEDAQPHWRETPTGAPDLRAPQPHRRRHDQIGQDRIGDPEFDRMSKTSHHHKHADHNRQSHHQGRDGDSVSSGTAGCMLYRDPPHNSPYSKFTPHISAWTTPPSDANWGQTGQPCQET